MRKPIQIKGISTTSSYEDGECLDMMNVRHEQGVLKPVEVFPTDFTLKNVYSLLYWHKNNSYTHLIGVRNNNVYWIKDKVTEIITNKEYTIVNAVYIDGKTTFQLSQSIAPDLNIGDKLISIDGIPKEQNLIVNINNYSDEISFDGNLTNDYYPGAPIIIGMVSFQTEMMADEVWLLQLAINKNVVISHIGNLINVLDGEVLKYIFWQDDKYLVINTDFDGAQTDTSIGPIGKIDLKVDGVVDGSARKTLNFYSDVDVTVGSPYDDKQKLAGGLLLKAKAYDDSKGRLTGFILACTAIELYDGNFILQSNPVLLGQAFDEKTRYTSTNISGHDYIDNPALYYSPGAVAWDDVASNEEKFYEKISDTIFHG